MVQLKFILLFRFRVPPPSVPRFSRLLVLDMVLYGATGQLATANCGMLVAALVGIWMSNLSPHRARTGAMRARRTPHAPQTGPHVLGAVIVQRRESRLTANGFG